MPVSIPQSQVLNPAAPRRDFLSWAANGLGATALISLLGRENRAEGIPSEARDPPPHVVPKARRVIHICCCGGYSQLDTFDYKPELARRHGQSLGGEAPETFFGQVGLLRQNDFRFKQHGQSGLWISELFPNV